MKRFGTLLIIATLSTGYVPVSAISQEEPGALRESRGVWLDKGQMFEGEEALTARLDRLKAAGFNTIYVATQVRGFVVYPESRILPQYDVAREKDPQILAWLLPAIHERGMRAEAWTEFGFYTYYTSDATKDSSRGQVLDKHPDLAAVSSDGREYLHNENWGDFYSLCPSNPKSQQILTDLYIEMLEKYDFDGLNLDRIRYPDASHCYCDYCRKHVLEDCGIELGLFAVGSKEHQAFVGWRKERLTNFMQGFSARFRQRFPQAKLTSAVVPPYMIDGKGQDWPTWLERGYLNAAMPMLYEVNITAMVEEIRHRVSPEALVFYGLDAGKGFGIFSRQVVDLRKLGAPGITVWYSGSVDPILPEIQRDLFNRPAVSPLYEAGNPCPSKGAVSERPRE